MQVEFGVSTKLRRLKEYTILYNYNYVLFALGLKNNFQFNLLCYALVSWVGHCSIAIITLITSINYSNSRYKYNYNSFSDTHFVFLFGCCLSNIIILYITIIAELEQ